MDSKDFDAFMRKCMNQALPSNEPKIVWRDALKNEVEKAKIQKEYKISYRMKPEDIMTFVSGLHNIQLDMIETVVARKEREGFPEAVAVIDHIRGLK